MKKILSLILVCLLTFAAVGCAAKPAETGTNRESSTERPTDVCTGEVVTKPSGENPTESATDPESATDAPSAFTDETGTVTVISYGILTIRSTPAFEDGNAVGYAEEGDTFPMTGRNGTFCRILYNGQTAYITASPKYVRVTLTPEENGSETATEPATDPDTETATETATEPATETESGKWGQTEYAPDKWQNSVVDTSKSEYTYEEMEEDLRILAARYPSFFTYKSLGTSLDGRNIYVATVGNPNAKKQIVVTAGVHAREYVSCLLVMAQTEFYLDNYTVGVREGEKFSDLFSECAVVIVPMVNPDGVTLAQKGIAAVRNTEVREKLLAAYESDKKAGLTASSSGMDGYFRTWKANLAGVDINRNFGTADWEGYHKMYRPSMQNFKGYLPESEPETKALTSLMASLSGAVASLCMHSQGEVVYWNCGQTGALRETTRDLARIAVNLTGYRYITEENHDASFSDYCVLNLGIPAITVEIGNGKGSSLVPADQIPGIILENRFLWTSVAAYFAE